MSKDAAEYASKIVNIVINLLGIISLIIGLSEIHDLDNREPENANQDFKKDLVSFIEMLLKI